MGDVLVLDVCPSGALGVGPVVSSVLSLDGSGVHLKLFIRNYIMLEGLEGGDAGGVGWEAELGFAEVFEDLAVYHVSGLFFKFLRYLDEGMQNFVGLRHQVAYVDGARVSAPRRGKRARVAVRVVVSAVRRVGLGVLRID